jgi:class 3 adenylate cyclase
VRVERGFAFVDLSGFTAFADRHGDERAVEVLATLRAALREAAARRGVRVVKWLGDGAMLSSTTTEPLVALVVELDQRIRAPIPDLALRAGLDVGRVIMFEGDDYIGRTVNLAARLCQVAGAHELLATAAVAGRRPAWVHAEPFTAIDVRGLEHPVDVCRLALAECGGDGVVDPVCGLRIASTLAAAGFCSEACADAWGQQRVSSATTTP